MTKRPLHKGFTLVEILIVVIILGILAAIVIPQFSNATQCTRASMLADDLRMMRTQVQVFKAQHNGISPGYAGGDATQPPTETDFVAQFTQASDQTCQTMVPPGTGNFVYGPYMSKIPENPINGLTSVQVLQDGEAFPANPTGTYGWIYQPSTLLFAGDTLGADESGRNYFDY